MHQVVFFYKLFTDVFLIFSQENCCFQGFLIQALVVQRFFYTNREEFKKDFFQLTGINGPAIGWKSRSRNPMVISFLEIWQALRSKNFLGTGGGGNQTAFSGTFGPEAVRAYLVFKISQKEIFQSNAGYRGCQAKIRKARLF